MEMGCLSSDRLVSLRQIVFGPVLKTNVDLGDIPQFKDLPI